MAWLGSASVRSGQPPLFFRQARGCRCCFPKVLGLGAQRRYSRTRQRRKRTKCQTNTSVLRKCFTSICSFGCATVGTAGRESTICIVAAFGNQSDETLEESQGNPWRPIVSPWQLQNPNDMRPKRAPFVSGALPGR